MRKKGWLHWCTAKRLPLYRHHQLYSKILAQLSNGTRPLRVSGMGRCDGPRHSRPYGDNFLVGHLHEVPPWLPALQAYGTQHGRVSGQCRCDGPQRSRPSSAIHGHTAVFFLPLRGSLASSLAPVSYRFLPAVPRSLFPDRRSKLCSVACSPPVPTNLAADARRSRRP